MQGLQDFNAPASLELVHKCGRQNALACSVSKVNECASWVVEGVVPTVRVFVFVGFLDPLEDLEEGLELDLTVGEVDVLQAALVSLPPALRLDKNKNGETQIVNEMNGRKQRVALELTYLANLASKVHCNPIEKVRPSLDVFMLLF